MFSGIGSYISLGVGKVSGPFHPFGGAVDIIVVQQPDGSFKSSPWYVRFGKFQGVLKATEKVVSINVNGVDAGFHMYLDHKGEAFFVREVDAAEGEFETYPSSGDEVDLKGADLWRTQKSKSYNFDANRKDLVSEFESSNGRMLARNSSRRARIFGIPFGRRSMKENGFRESEGSNAVDRANSLERAEIAADLLEVRWETNLATPKSRKADSHKSPNPKLPVPGVVSEKGSSLIGEQPICSTAETPEEVSCSTSPENHMDIFALQETYVGGDDGKTNKEGNAERKFSEVSTSVVQVSDKSDTDQNVTEIGCGKKSSVESTVSCYTVEDSIAWLDNDNGQSNESLSISDEAFKEPNDHSPLVFSETVLTVCTNSMDKKEDDVVDEVSADKVLNCSSGSVNEENSQELYSYPSDVSSLPPVSDKESPPDDMARNPFSWGAKELLGDNVQQKNLNLTSSESLDEEQFSFSDLDDLKVEKVDQKEVFSAEGGKRCVPQNSSGKSDDELLIDQISPKVESKASSPITISKTNADGKFVAPLAESLPNMQFIGDDNPNPNGVPQPLSRSLDSNFGAVKMVGNDARECSESVSEKEQVAAEQIATNSSQISEQIKKIVSDPAVEVSLCGDLLYEGMGYEAAARAFDAQKLEMDKFSSLGPDIIKNDKLVVRIGGLYFPWEAALPIASAIGSKGREQILEPKGMIAVGQADNASEGVPQKSLSSRNGSWRMWPFSFKRSNSNISDSGKNISDSEKKISDTETSARNPIEKQRDADVAENKVRKKKLRAKTPTSEQLASLNLKEGNNVVIFTFSTAMLGKQQVDARIFLWKWNTRIVISDVDGTITKSDVLGQFMPLMGMDWSQTGVTHLFSAIKENGYNLLFLSARSISQAYHTRQFLINLKQDGKALPEGPVVISPDGLFPSLYREVIRRAPHEFKISCLEDIKELFPKDHNPFYAGFGNRDTDELSYLRVGIPRGKIFTINPKGQVAVNRRVDTKSYTSLHALVHGMFPPTTVTEQEDYNSWNFWRLPPPNVDI